MGMGGVYREIVRPERLVATEKFDEPWYEGDALDTTTFVERGARPRPRPRCATRRRRFVMPSSRPPC